MGGTRADRVEFYATCNYEVELFESIEYICQNTEHIHDMENRREKLLHHIRYTTIASYLVHLHKFA